MTFHSDNILPAMRYIAVFLCLLHLTAADPFRIVYNIADDVITISIYMVPPPPAPPVIYGTTLKGTRSSATITNKHRHNT